MRPRPITPYKAADVLPGDGRRIGPMPRLGTSQAEHTHGKGPVFCPQCAPGIYAERRASHRSDRP